MRHPYHSTSDHLLSVVKTGAIMALATILGKGTGEDLFGRQGRPLQGVDRGFRVRHAVGFRRRQGAGAHVYLDQGEDQRRQVEGPVVGRAQTDNIGLRDAWTRTLFIKGDGRSWWGPVGRGRRVGGGGFGQL